MGEERKSIEDFFQTADDRTYFTVYRGLLRYALDYLASGAQQGDVHGWDFVERTFEYYKGSGVAETATVEKLIVLLFKLGVVTPMYYCPTVSQRAFQGLQHFNKKFLRSATSLAAFPQTDFITHFQFQVNRQALDEALMLDEIAHEKSSYQVPRDKTFVDLPVDAYFLFKSAKTLARKIDEYHYEEIATGQQWHFACPDMLVVRELTEAEMMVTDENIAAHFAVEKIKVKQGSIYARVSFGPGHRWEWLGYQNAILSEIILKRVQKS
jgi:hypothetical protein